VLSAVLVVQGVLVVAGVGRRTTSPHDVPVTVQGPAVVAQEIVARVDHLAAHPIRARSLPADADPRSAVRDGAVEAALVVDVRSSHDHLYVSGVADPEMVRVMRVFAARVGKPLDRPTTVSAVAPRDHPGLTRRVLVAAVTCWLLGGFLLGAVLAIGRPGWTSRRRAGALAAGSLLVGLATGILVAAHGGPLITTTLVGFGAGLAVAVATTALDALFGLVGVAVATTALVFLAAPLFIGRDPRLLPSPWRQVAPWTPHGAALELASSLVWFGGRDAVRPLLALAGLLLVGLAAWAGARPRGPRSASGAASESALGTWRGARHSVRLRAVGLAAPVALAVVALVVLAPTGRPVVSATPVPGAAETECLHRHTITSLDQLNKAILSVRAGPSFQGADVGADVELQDGRLLWLFADTLRAASFDGEKFVRNSMLVIDSHCLQTVLPADHGALIPDRGKVGYWPMSVARIRRADYDIVGVATQRVRTTSKPDGIFAFQTLGPAMAVFVVPRGRTPQLVANQDIGPDDVDTTRPMWGAASAIDGDWVYLYGTARPDAKGIFGFSLQVARTKVDDLLHSDHWQYWDGRSWQRDPSRAKVLIPADGGVSQTLSVFQRGHQWYAVSKRNEVLGTDLVVWTAPSPTGPFDHGTKVASLPSDPTSGELRYMPLAHPTLLPEKDSVLVSYSRNNTDASKVQGDPFLYRPLFMRVRLPR
jgi:hypothetical protein